MNLATRCPSCGTVFRVVPDQLRVSDGWVRCGRCNGVFDAAEVLFDIDSGAQVNLDIANTPAAAGAPDAPAPAQPFTVAPGPAAEPAIADEPPPAAPPASPPAPAPAPASARPPPGPVEPGFADDDLPDIGGHPAFRDEPLLRAPSRTGDADEPIVISDHLPPEGGRPLEPGFAPHAPPDMPGAAAMQAPPSFLQTADRDALWRRPAVRGGLWVGVLLLGAGALLQMAMLWRDHLGAHLPATRPALQAMCRAFGCTLQPLRRIESLAVDSSGLNRLEGSSLYRLQLVLHNHADVPVMMPALELTLTDGQGQLVARRVLQAAELGAPLAALQAGQELPIQALLSTGERRVDGYTLELFYP